MKIKIKKIITFVLPLSLFLFIPIFAFAETKYVMLEALPNINKEGTTFSDYLSGLFKLSMGLAVVLAVFQISHGGFLYITSDSFMKTTKGKDKVVGAVTGLLILLTSYLLLNTINPDLIKLDFKIPKATAKKTTSVKSEPVINYNYNKDKIYNPSSDTTVHYQESSSNKTFEESVREENKSNNN